MDGNLLTIAFAIFVVFMILLTLFLRNTAVDDIFSNDKTTSFSDTAFSSKARDFLPSAPTNNGLSSTSQSKPLKNIGLGTLNKPSFEWNQRNINLIGKVLGFIGVMLLFVPLPETFKSVGLWLAIIGSLVARATKASKKKTAQQNNSGAVKSSPVDTLRKLATKPEYREAMQILSVDVAKQKLDSDAQRQERAIRYLQSKGVSAKEATRNIKVMVGYLKAQQNEK